MTFRSKNLDGFTAYVALTKVADSTYDKLEAYLKTHNVGQYETVY
jgi:hypothetical protein